MKSILVLLCALLLSGAPNLVAAKMGKCVLQVSHKTYLKGACNIEFTDNQGSFTIGISKTHRARYFAYINMEDDGAHAYWNETPEASHAHTSLGILKPQGDCWVNETARVCAFK